MHKKQWKEGKAKSQIGWSFSRSAVFVPFPCKIEPPERGLRSNVHIHDIFCIFDGYSSNIPSVYSI